MYFTTSIAMAIDRREIPLDYQQHTNEREKVLPYHKCFLLFFNFHSTDNFAGTFEHIR